MYKCLQILCAKIISLGICFKKLRTALKLARLLDTASKFALFSLSDFKDETLIKSKPT